MKRVVVGLSGGVDSSVTAYLLQQQGYDVVGIFMKNWHDTEYTISDECPWIEDSNDALLIAQQLNIPFQTIDFSVEYKERIVDYMFKEYEAGRTPNPDVLCNREVKFDLFMELALKLGADYVATGHYARKESFKQDGKTIYRLLAGKDNNKDQSYFLCQLSQDQLAKALFPIGELEKSEVRAIAKEAGLGTAEKKDSQGLCFIGKVKLPDFLQQQLKPKQGKVYEVLNFSSEGLDPFEEYDFSSAELKEIGTHNGAHYYTVGQRKGLGIGGTPLPLFVVGIDAIKNIVYMAQGDQNPALSRYGLTVLPNEIHWVREDLKLAIGESADYEARIRYRQALCKVKLMQTSAGLKIIFEEAQKGIAKGQFVAWYLGEELIGSGVIS